MEIFWGNPDRQRKMYFNSLQNYKNRIFWNIENTPFFIGKGSILSIILERMKIPSNASPQKEISHQFTDIKVLDMAENVLIWLGHSSYFIQIDGKKILVDPVLCEHVMPFSKKVKSFADSDIYKVSDIPAIEFLFISHDHGDHLDYQTVKILKSATG